MYKLLKKIIPYFIKKKIRYKLDKYCDKKKKKSKKYFCPVCQTYVSHFNRLSDFYFEKLFENRAIHSIFQIETINLLNYSCPNCGASDRNRLYALYLEKILSKDSNINLIHFAPTKPLSEFIKKNYPNIKYRTADLYADGVDDKVDITDLKIYKNEQFDAFICSHVLEHVQDDIKALKELYRILKKDGWGILMVPINLGIKEIYENPNITSSGERWKHFGQYDHVRVYSKEGFKKRIKSVGFKIYEYDVNYFGEEIFNKCGIHKYSVLYIVRK